MSGPRPLDGGAVLTVFKQRGLTEGHLVREPRGEPPGKGTAGRTGRDSHICELPDLSRAGPVQYEMEFFPTAAAQQTDIAKMGGVQQPLHPRVPSLVALARQRVGLLVFPDPGVCVGKGLTEQAGVLSGKQGLHLRHCPRVIPRVRYLLA